MTELSIDVGRYADFDDEDDDDYDDDYMQTGLNQNL